MEKRKLGSSDLDLTRVGFGAWAIGGGGWQFGWGPQDDKESIEAIHKALEMGVNWIDTAAVYGLGRSEKVVAHAVKEWSGKKPYLFTKCVLRWKDDGSGMVYKTLKPESIREECENSLRRLNADVIDLYQVHWPPDNNDAEIEPAWEMMAKLKEEGKVRYIGVSNFNVAQIKIAGKIAPVTSLQPPYNLITRGIEKEILSYCLEKNIGVIVYSPMASGLLTGAMTRERVENFPKDDWRRENPDFLEPKLSKNLKLVDKLREIAAKYGKTPGEAAIAWTLKNPAVTAAIVGARNGKQALGVMNAAELKLSNEEIKELESF